MQKLFFVLVEDVASDAECGSRYVPREVSYEVLVTPGRGPFQVWRYETAEGFLLDFPRSRHVLERLPGIELPAPLSR